ncbi:MAG: hypothetical protein KDA49_16340 [Rhodospirillaceae bacterium]|nr:hypothetical protein [Rhodospirillaceae bacterium]
MDRGPRSEGDKTFGLIFLGIAGLVVVAVLYYIFFTGDEPHRWDIACALVGGTVREDYPIVRARTGHRCHAEALRDGDPVWTVEGMVNSMGGDQPDVPYTGVLVWDDAAAAFTVCEIRY